MREVKPPPESGASALWQEVQVPQKTCTAPASSPPSSSGNRKIQIVTKTFHINDNHRKLFSFQNAFRRYRQEKGFVTQWIKRLTWKHTFSVAMGLIINLQQCYTTRWKHLVVTLCIVWKINHCAINTLWDMNKNVRKMGKNSAFKAWKKAIPLHLGSWLPYY